MTSSPRTAASLICLAAACLPAGAQEAAPSNVTIGEDGINIQSDDGKVTFHVGGRLQLDFGDGSESSRFFDHAFEDHFVVRRARLDLGLSVKDVIEAAFQYDFANKDAPIADAVIAYTGVENALFTVGNMKEPFSLDQLTSDTNTMFIERSLADAFAPARNTGFAVGATDDENWTFAAGVFGGNINDEQIDKNGVAGTARLTYAPIKTDETTVHLGIAGSYRAFEDRYDTVSFSTDPEAALFGANLVETGDITNADSLSLLGLEGAFRQEAFRVQGEYILAHVDRSAGTSPTFQAAYLEAAFVLNGAASKYGLAPDYGAAYATFGGVKITDEQRVSKGGFGVFEIAGRVSYIDLQDDTVRGGTEVDWTAGLNWYPDKNLRVMTNYIHAEAENAPGARGRDVDADIFEARLQIAY